MVAVVLVGAGASFGSIGATPVTPPLGDRLFDSLAALHGVADSIPPEIKDVFGREGFENGMAAYYKFVKGDVRSFQRELAQYLASFQPTPESVYCDLIRSLCNARVVYSSLNYDLLFELAASMIGFNTVYSSQYVKDSVRLLKIHGSSNFWPDFGTNQIRVGSIVGVATDVEAPVVILDRQQTLYRCQTDSFAPAIAVYANGKPVRTCPDYVRNQYKMWHACINKATKIVLVGVAVHLPDEHIWSVLGNVKGNVYYFGLERDRQAFEKWRASFKKDNAYFTESDFRNSISIIQRRIG